MSDEWEVERLRLLLADSGDDLLRYFERRVADREDAADLLSEAAMTAWRRIGDLPQGDAGRLWLFGVAAKVLANHRRSRRRYDALVDRLRLELRAAPPRVPDTDEAVAVRDAVGRLRSDHRELVMLVHWDGFTVADAAEILGLNASTARSRYSAARESLRSTLGAAASTVGQ